MATNNETLERSTPMDEIRQLEQGGPPKPARRTFTSDQRWTLREAYRQILSWQPMPAIPTGSNTVQHAIPNLVVVEVEA